MKTTAVDLRIATTLKALTQVKHRLHAFQFPPSKKVESRLVGGHLSGFRGRGLEFEEFRHYQAGDDVRNIDWLVTAKTNQPHVREYRQEKDRTVLLCVDQRSNMYFSTVEIMKSVVAAQVTAALSWQVLQQSDRVGALVFGTQGLSWFKPRRAHSELLRLFRLLETENKELVKRNSETERVTFNGVVQRLLRQKLKGAVIVVISDFSDFDSETRFMIRRLQAHNDLVCVSIQDPMEQELLIQEAICFSDGELQVAVDSSFQEKIDNYNTLWQQHHLSVKQELQSLGIPYLQLDTSGQHFSQLKQQLSEKVDV
ncbi:DUF58 domain-containing protein [Vibrio sp. ER1A]|uniref:DUF58 domain-containing protein n=1 Tax=Vibrio sp. ER1A TaxID=1517681 RepID=UPI0004DD44E2|nr:DUF58 domain-containing protein [Vibrio sp. ER1A]KFA98000.1 hypothetical protein HW45_11570 [Vibrio sp. ER1A]